MRYLLTYKKLILLILAYTFIFIPSGIKSDENRNELYAIQEIGKFGFIDNKGKVIIKPQFDNAYSSITGIAHVKKGDKWGFIDYTGDYIIQPKFDHVIQFIREDPFNEDLACVGIKDKDGVINYGYINKEGKFIIEPKYNLNGQVRTGSGIECHHIPVYNFSDGLAAVLVDCKWGYIDKKGKFVIKPKYKSAKSFHDGLAAVETYKGPLIKREWVYINKKNKIMIDGKYNHALDFSEGLAGVKIGDKYGFIDTAGRIVIKPQFDFVWWFSKGLCQVELNKKDFYINKNGGIVLRPKFYIGNMYGKLTWIYIEEKKIFGYMNRKGEIVFLEKNPRKY